MRIFTILAPQGAYRAATQYIESEAYIELSQTAYGVSEADIITVYLFSLLQIQLSVYQP